MNSKFYVSLEVARLLKEKGYDKECDYYIEEKIYGHMTKEQAEKLETKFPCPTKAEAIDWLESKGIVLETLYAYMEGIYFYTVYYNNEEIDVPSSRRYKTRLEAEDAGIKKALELILEEGE